MKDRQTKNIVRFIIVEAKEIHLFSVNLAEKDQASVESQTFEINKEIPKMYNQINIMKVEIEDLDEIDNDQVGNTVIT